MYSASAPDCDLVERAADRTAIPSERAYLLERAARLVKD